MISRSISETVFFERLEEAIGNQKTKELKDFLNELSNDLNLILKLGRGKTLSLSIKSEDDLYNFGAIRDNGEVTFYAIINKTENLGDKNIGIDYLEDLVVLVNGKVETKYNVWHWCVKRGNNYINIVEYLVIKNDWKKLIGRTVNRIKKLEDQ